jgi:predicted GH43/DUF377 family glycosyl hydrolase
MMDSFMIKVSRGKIVLEGRPGVEFENNGVLNPACVDKDGVTYIFYRAVRKGNFSTIGLAKIKDGKEIYRSDKPVIEPEYIYERHGVEDPRITLMEGKYYLFYTAYDGKNAVVAYAISYDLITWKKMGVISPQISYDEAEDIFRNSGVGEKYTYFEERFRKDKGEGVYLWEKDTALFPKKINGKYAIIHRVLPGIQVLYFDNFEQLTQDYWRNYLANLKKYSVLEPKYSFENDYIGGGCVPIETEEGWLIIFHSVEVDIKKGRVYHASAALLDINDPTKVIGRLPYPLFSPENSWEKKGVINNVVFPTGVSVKGDKLLIYYGAADNVIGVRQVSCLELIREMKNEIKKTN